MNNTITKLDNFQKFNSFPFHIDIISPTETIPPHYHDCVEMIFVKEGRTINCIDSSPFNYRRRHLFLISGPVSHSLFDFDNFSAYRLLFDMSIFDDFSEELKTSNAFISLFVMSSVNIINHQFHGVMSVSEENTLRLFSIFDNILHLYENTAKPEAEIKRLFFEATELILQQYDENCRDSSYYKKQLFLFFATNLSEPLSVPELADKFQISTVYLHKLFKNIFAKSPLQVLKDMRIRNAKMLLTLTDKSITEIAAACGFNNPVYFAEIFKANVGVSPSQYRKNTKKRHSLTP